MPLILSLEDVSAQDGKLVGGKSLSLALLAKGGFRVPRSICLTIDAYRRFLGENGLGERIHLELSRKNLEDMRWEEIWDAALRIRNLFLTNPMDSDLRSSLKSAISENFNQVPVAIRSSAPEEDSASSSFAGVHESFINIIGAEAILDHIRLVWASLWSDAALLYRQELGLLTGDSAMAVLIQEVIPGRCSGILFTRSPADSGKCAIEAVHGLNQALVDGLIEPDRWFLDRSDGKVETLFAPRTRYMIRSKKRIEIRSLPHELRNKPPLRDTEVRQLYEVGLKIEKYYGRPQDIEWTFKNGELFILQARPISTAATGNQDDMRPWYLSLHRSLDNLKTLRAEIEKKLLPAMIEEAHLLQQQNFDHLSNSELADEIENRKNINAKWTDAYWRYFIPFAHGMRLFGQVYNDAVRPDNPYEFVDLLVHTPLQSITRNRKLRELADIVSKNQMLRGQLENGVKKDFVDNKFSELLSDFISHYGDLSCSLGLDEYCKGQTETLLAVIVKIADNPPTLGNKNKQDSSNLLEQYLGKFPPDKREEANEILELGRASYRLRDDDNIYLGHIEREVGRVLDESHRRLLDSDRIPIGGQVEVAESLKALRDIRYHPIVQDLVVAHDGDVKKLPKARQLIGQPAGPGVARGRARLLGSVEDLGKVSKGEVLVCDAIEPNMTFVVPLAAAIVERRGGMLIHGAIIAREYGIPCVTGIPDAMDLIANGYELNVDGYLGIVTVLSGNG